MASVDIQIANLRYRFRQLPWHEEARLTFPKGVPPIRVILIAALSEVSGTPISSPDAERILAALPDMVVLRVWKQYRVDLPRNRYYTSGTLFEAPDAIVHQRRMDDEAEVREETSEQAHARLEAESMREVGQAMFRNAQAAGTLTPAKEDKHA